MDNETLQPVFKITMIGTTAYGIAVDIEDITGVLETYFGDSDEWHDMDTDKPLVSIEIVQMSKEEIEALPALVDVI